MARLIRIDWHDFGTPDLPPPLTLPEMAARLAAFRRAGAAAGHDLLVVYGDREHSANLHWLTGFDPRFEEAVLVVAPDSALLLENEGRSTAESLGGVSRLASSRQISNVILVSDPFHMMRLQILSWRYHLRAVPSPTQTSPISANRMESITYVLSESLKVPLTALLALTPGATS